MISNVWCLEICAGTLFVMLLKFGAVLSIICGFLMVIYTWTHLLQCIVVVRLFLRMLKLRKLAVRKLYPSRGGRTRCQGVLDHGSNLHRNIPLKSKLFRSDIRNIQIWPLACCSPTTFIFKVSGPQEAARVITLNMSKFHEPEQRYIRDKLQGKVLGLFWCWLRLHWHYRMRLVLFQPELSTWL